MQTSPKISRVLGCTALLWFASIAGCAHAVYDTDPTGADFGEGGGLSVAGGPVMVTAGAPSEAGAFTAGGSTQNEAGSPSVAGAPATAGAPGAGGSMTGSAGHTSSGGSGGSTSTGSCTAKAWDAGTVYMTGDKASKGGKEYTAAYYTMTDPETHCCGNGAEWASSVSCK